jgi:hypothetical protein
VVLWLLTNTIKYICKYISHYRHKLISNSMVRQPPFKP